MSAADRRAIALSMRQSKQAREALSAPEELSPQREDGRFTTRSAMLEARRLETAANATAKNVNLKSSLPVGKLPGAPGKRQDYERKVAQI